MALPPAGRGAATRHRGQRTGQLNRVIHEIATDRVRTVGDAIWKSFAARHQAAASVPRSALAAMTTWRAPSHVSLRSGRRIRTPLMRRRVLHPLARRQNGKNASAGGLGLRRCTVASYLACTGQIGMHVELAQQAGRPSNGREFRACGDTRTLRPAGPATRPSAGHRARRAIPAWDTASGAPAEHVVVVAGYAKFGFG